MFLCPSDAAKVLQIPHSRNTFLMLFAYHDDGILQDYHQVIRLACRKGPQILLLGEATKKIPADVKYAWQSILWRDMAGMRDKLVHDYMGVNYYIVWDVAKNIIPKLTVQIESIISSVKNN